MPAAGKHWVHFWRIIGPYRMPDGRWRLRLFRTSPRDFRSDGGCGSGRYARFGWKNVWWRPHGWRQTRHDPPLISSTPPDSLLKRSLFPGERKACSSNPHQIRPNSPKRSPLSCSLRTNFSHPLPLSTPSPLAHLMKPRCARRGAPFVASGSRLEQADKILGWSVKQLCLEGPEERLAETKYCQPIMQLGLPGRN